MAGLKKIHAWFSLDIKPKCILWWKHRQSGSKSSNSSVGPVDSCPDGSWRIAGCPMMRKAIPADGVVLIASLTPCSLWLSLGKNAFVCLMIFLPLGVLSHHPHCISSCPLLPLVLHLLPLTHEHPRWGFPQLSAPYGGAEIGIAAVPQDDEAEDTWRMHSGTFPAHLFPLASQILYNSKRTRIDGE